ncbi:MAG: sterol desaturase family protein [bacterium]
MPCSPDRANPDPLDMSIIQASIPIFFLLLGIEYAYTRVRGVQLFRLNDSIAAINIGILSQITGIVIKVITIGFYYWVWEHLSLRLLVPAVVWPEGAPFTSAVGFPWFGVRIPELLSWSVVFVLVDLAYYWSHRMSHEVHLFWAGHVVHHSSQEYNLAVALRQSALHGLFIWLFYLPLAMLGVPALMWVVCHGINLIYQFWIHTRAVGRLSPWAEYVLNTPSHHRVHHGVNPKYQDKNYAGVFITWDRVFGTFVVEEEEPVYGITHPLQTWNPLWANLHVFVELWRLFWLTRGWRNKARVLFGSPNWRPPEAGVPIVPPDVTVDNVRKFDPEMPPGLMRYVAVQFALVILGGMQVLAWSKLLPGAQTAAAAFYVVLTVTNIGGLLEGEAWARVLEQIRLFSLASACATLLVTGALPRGPVALAFGGLLLCSLWLRALPTAPPHR